MQNEVPFFLQKKDVITLNRFGQISCLNLNGVRQKAEMKDSLLLSVTGTLPANFISVELAFKI